MSKDIDTLSVELTKSFGSSNLPPKLKYRIQKWLRNLNRDSKRSDTEKSEMKEIIKQELVTAFGFAGLEKNEMMATTFSDGSVKLDFGSGIPAHIKKAAMKWATARGLKPVEASLDKSDNKSTHVVLAKGKIDSNNQYINKVKWTIPLT